MAKSATLCCLLIVVMAGAVYLVGCRGSEPTVDRVFVEQVMTNDPGPGAYWQARAERMPGVDRVVAAGETAIPWVFDVMRKRPSTPVTGMGYAIIRRMASEGTGDPSAPYIRGILADTGDRETLRATSAVLLGWYWNSPEVRKVLAAHASHDPSERVRSACLVIMRRFAKAPLDPLVVRRALSEFPAECLEYNVVRDTGGDEAIPLIFDELRIHPDREWRYAAWQLVADMRAGPPLPDRVPMDASAPYLRKVLTDTNEKPAIRRTSALMLTWFGDSPEVKKALEQSARSDASPSIRKACRDALENRKRASAGQHMVTP